MRAWLCLLCFCFSLLANPSDVLFNASGGPSQALLDILQFADIEHDGSWPSIVAATQALAVSTPLSYQGLFPQQALDREVAFCLFEKLGIFEPVCATQSHYDYAVIFGGWLWIVKERFFWLKQAWQQGVTFDSLVFLTGPRPLSSAEHETLCEDIHDETEMMIALFHCLELPSPWRSLPLLIIDAPAEPGNFRPSTADTLKVWAASAPPPGKALFLSSQPSIGRQDAIARKYLPKEIEIETIGPGVCKALYTSRSDALQILYQNLFWWIYAVVGDANNSF